MRTKGKLNYSKKFLGIKIETENGYEYKCPRLLDVLIITKELKEKGIHFEENFDTRTVRVTA